MRLEGRIFHPWKGSTRQKQKASRHSAGFATQLHQLPTSYQPQATSEQILPIVQWFSWGGQKEDGIFKIILPEKNGFVVEALNELGRMQIWLHASCGTLYRLLQETFWISALHFLAAHQAEEFTDVSHCSGDSAVGSGPHLAQWWDWERVARSLRPGCLHCRFCSKSHRIIESYLRIV